ncbi:hypothetical protein EC845_2537 [Comamonas sp. BIGb0124]|uniref:hypothetical protein n=1 Tax=Comamonas sp. BIGb0124 TaxID=2485130 RepID=UPI000FB68752|nr:hypothetical protein [Comamonas sp. BIGb0124]ROR21715.1 hypothetical protein EC845_2537 [Comamonas sp. BIGb0124]
MKRLLIGVLGAAMLVGGAAFTARAYVMSDLRGAVRDQFKDPDSTLFRGEYLVFDRHDVALCGEINAKNEMGGYVGYRPFEHVKGIGPDLYKPGASLICENWNAPDHIRWWLRW